MPAAVVIPVPVAGETELFFSMQLKENIVKINIKFIYIYVFKYFSILFDNLRSRYRFPADRIYFFDRYRCLADRISF